MKNLLEKYVLNECSREEVDEVVACFQEIKESSQLPSVEDVLELLDEKPLLNEATANRIRHNLFKEIQKEKKESIRKKSIWRYAAAAVVIGVLSTTYFLRTIPYSTQEEAPNLANTIVPGTDKATLTLEDGSVVQLEKGAAFKTKNARSNGEEIVYENTAETTATITYNYLSVPSGGQYFLKLSDGTKVWLNSASQLKYPVQFIEGETRKVELVYGEAYFDVSPSTVHKGATFKVLNQSQEIEVLGTEFNIKSYKDEVHVVTTLVEGKVIVSNGVFKQYLVPNQQFDLNTETANFSVAEVDVKNEIAWKDGLFRFVNKPLKDIMKVVSRWYDVEVVFENKALESVEFTGALNKDQRIEEILSIMKSYSINAYEIKGTTIVLR